MGAAVYDGSRPLKDATVQEIQLELIRRSLFGGIKGELI